MMYKLGFSFSLLLIHVVCLAQLPISTSRNAFDSTGYGVSNKRYDEDYRIIYEHTQTSIIGFSKANALEVKSKNPAYKKISLHPDYILSHQLNEAYQYLYMAHVEHMPNAQGNSKEEILLFYSSHNIREKQRWKGDAKLANVKEIAQDIGNKTVVVSETAPDIFIEVNKYYSGQTSPKEKAFGTTTYIYDITSLHPNKNPVIIGKLIQYKLGIQSKKSYESQKLINYSQNGKVSGTVEYIAKEDGYSLPLYRFEKLDEKGNVQEINFNDYLGINMETGQVFMKVDLTVPASVKKQWPLQIRNFKTEPNLLSELGQIFGIDPVQNLDQLKELFINFSRLNENVILDSVLTVFRVPKKYIYKGTYNEKGLPHGWGVMYLANSMDEEFYLGQFNNGLPDGLGIRHDFNLDKPEFRYGSKGFHVGNTLVYGVQYKSSPNGNGHYVTYGDFRQGELSGIGSIIWSQGINGVGDVQFGHFQNGRLNGDGSFYSSTKMQVGLFENGQFVSGNSLADKSSDNRFYPGAVVMYQGKKYVIMKKEKETFLLDNGISVSTKANLTLTGERSLRAKNCLVCGGTGYLKPTTNTVFSGVTQKNKTYLSGPTGYIVWEKTTTSTTAPVTTSKTSRCTACTGGLAGNDPVPLEANKR